MLRLVAVVALLRLTRKVCNIRRFHQGQFIVRRITGERRVRSLTKARRARRHSRRHRRMGLEGRVVEMCHGESETSK
ncbi:hypothetical protein [Roseateles depolymerans]|nr:hypothetical protein [Roseateles depolymerans]